MAIVVKECYAHRQIKTRLNVWTVQRSGSNREVCISMDSTVNGNPTTF